MKSLDVLTRRELCEDCEHSRGSSVTLCCIKKYYSPCMLSAAVKKREATCPRGDDYAEEWAGAELDSPERNCQGRIEVPVEKQVADYMRGRESVNLSNVSPRGLGRQTMIVYIDKKAP